MRVKILCGISSLLSILLVLCVFNLKAQENQISEFNVDSVGKYKLEATLLKSKVKIGQSIKLKIRLDNLSNEDIFMFVIGNPLKMLDIKVKDSKGKVIVLKEPWQRNPNEPWGGSQATVQVKKGEHREFEEDVSVFYNLPVGEYEISIEQPLFLSNKDLDAEKQIRLKAKPIKIIVEK